MKKIDCILLVDDNDDDNFFHSMVIEDANVTNQVRTATDGQAALEYLAQEKTDPVKYPFPSLIFLDINMPRLNGFQFLDKVKENKYFDGRKVVVIMLTGSLNPNDAQLAKEKYPDEIKDYKIKPLTVEMLHEIADKYFV